MNININHGQSSALVIRVDIPALSDLVAYLQANEQKQIDALTTQVGNLTKQLKESSDSLSQAIATEQK